MKSASASWIKRGVETSKEMAKEDAAKAAKRNTGTRRFWLKPGEEAKITFIDGKLTEYKGLDVPSFYQHTVFQNGTWFNFYVCVKDKEPCPLCMGGDVPSLVGVITIIDHRKIVTKQGNTYKDQKRLFVAKSETMKILQNIATKRENGLSGLVVSVFRTSDKSASVGNQFDVLEVKDVAELRKAYMEKDAEGKMRTIFVPADIEKEFVYRTADELRAMGFGPAKKIVSDEEQDTYENDDEVNDEENDIPF